MRLLGSAVIFLIILNCGCESHLIVGGSETAIESYPFVVSLQLRLGKLKLHICGASVISEKYLLSAAHCNPGVLITMLYAKIGRKFIKADKFYNHPLFSKITTSNDIAVVELYKYFQLCDIKPVVLAQENNPDPILGEIGIILGWGTDGTSNSASKNLKSTKIEIADSEKCSEIYDDFSISRNICGESSSDYNISAGSCFGDSGGPLLVDGIQVGIISGGASCDQSVAPGVYTKISYYKKWITVVANLK